MNKEILGLGWVKFKDNLYPFFCENTWIIVLWAFTATLDAYSTTLFMQITGPEMELHPLTRVCSYSTGVNIGPYLSGGLKFAMALPLLVCYKKEARYVLLLCCLFQSYAYFFNMESFEYLAARIPQEFWWNWR